MDQSTILIEDFNIINEWDCHIFVNFFIKGHKIYKKESGKYTKKDIEDIIRIMMNHGYYLDFLFNKDILKYKINYIMNYLNGEMV